LNPNAVMLLLNALCFEADWSKPYGADFVREGKFTNADGSASTVEMMYGEENTYYDDGKATGFGKSYAGGQYSFVGVLPNEGVSMEDYLSALMLDDGLRKLLDSAKDTEVMAELPKFSFSYDETLNDMLMSLGMPTAFDSGSADFSRLSRASGCYISRVLHKTFIDLCENGTRAGAVTAVELTRKGLPVEMKRVCLDRPFVFMILDESNGGIPIFIGIVNSL
jgi:serpin B